MKKLLLILFCLPIIGFGQVWTFEYLSNGYGFNTIYFYNDTIGYAVGDNGAIIKTTNAGDNWISINSNTIKNITDIIFINNDTGYYCTEGAVNPAIIEGEIFATYNGGISWTSIFISPTVNESYMFYKFHKVENSSLFILGCQGVSSPFNQIIMEFDLLNSSYSFLYNGGSQIAFDSYNYSSNSYTSVSGTNLNGGGTFNANFIKTNISGVNISPNYPSGGIGQSLYSIDMLDANPINGITVGKYGKIYNLTNMTSVNNVITENSSFTNTIIDLWSVDMMNDKGWIVGDLGTILFTVDSGQTWTQYNNPILFEDIHSVTFLEKCNGWLAGENGLIGHFSYEENKSIDICQNSASINLFNILDSNAINLGGIWNDSLGNPISPVINPSTLTLGTHSFYYTFYLCNEVKESVVQITIVEVPNINTTVLNTLYCNGDSSGMAQVNMLNGSIIYTSCLWSNGATSPIVSNLAAGIYIVSVTDTNGCSANSSVTITQPSVITPTIAITDVTCNGGSNGSIIAIASGGVPPYQYSLGGGLSQSNGAFTGVNAGTYLLDVTDANGCMIFQTVVINEPTPINSSSTLNNISCYGLCDGSINVIASGGTSTYSYSWSNGQTTSNISNLCQGTYNVTITDINSCYIVDSFFITQPTIPQLQQSFTICPGDSIVVGNNVYDTTGIYTDTLGGTGGCDTIVYTSIQMNSPVIWQQTNTICDGDSVQVGWNTYHTAGTYTDTISGWGGGVCDSIIYTTIIVNQNTSSYDTLSVIASIVWNGIPLNISGDYSFTLTNLLGCDSIANLNLTVTNPSGILNITNTKKTLLRMTDILGRQSNGTENKLLFYIYDDGTVEKRIVIE